MAELSELAGLMSRSPTAAAPSAVGEAGQPSAKRIRPHTGDLSPVKRISPMGVRSAGSGGVGCRQ
eukprot:9026086-Alexandrium_andersonii.AAC.1